MNRLTISLLGAGMLTIAVAALAQAQIYQQYNNPGGSTIYGPGGRTYQQYDNPWGSTIYGPGR